MILNFGELVLQKYIHVHYFAKVLPCCARAIFVIYLHSVTAHFPLSSFGSVL